MSEDEYNEKEVTDTKSIIDFIGSIKSKKSELVLVSNGETVGAIVTAEQYEWFLDQIDSKQDLDKIQNRSSDMKDSQSLEDFKKELGE